MEPSRRSFFGLIAAAPAAVPAIVKEFEQPELPPLMSVPPLEPMRYTGYGGGFTVEGY